MPQSLLNKRTLLFAGLGGFFVANALIAEFMGVKLFSLERSLGWTPADLTLFGESGLSFNLSAGVLLWPFVFVLTDLVNEYFGPRGVRFLAWMTVAFMLYGFAMFYLAIGLEPADFFVQMHLSGLEGETRTAAAARVGDFNAAYGLVFGQSMWIIAGSVTAFLVSQLVDVFVFHSIKKRTGENQLWLRATGSTLVSQLIDSFVVLGIAFLLPGRITFANFIALGLIAYTYKFLMAILLTPAIYGAHALIDRYLGEELSSRLRTEAMTV